ncbi:dTDP-6-deoxy-D-glucose-3,5-epimerase [Escherichia coli]|nr:dTDP-6-deoxy-D-glucose-3,5-epimerase [Escherichia coli]
MTTITKERLLTIKQWRETYGPGSNVVLPAEEAEELARITLAALEAEPVLYQSCTRPTWNSGVPWTEWKERSREGYENDLRFTDTPDHAGWINKCRKLYTTPPVPVIQADVAQAIENLKQKLVECNRYNYCADAVKGVEDACRAAMLKGDKS